MRHTDITPLLSRIRNLEKEELKKAVAAHGGLYRFDKDNRPVITSPFSDSSDTAQDIDICQASVNGEGNLCLTGIPHLEFRDIEIEYDPDDFAPGQLSFITNDIPETDEVKDVSTDTALLSSIRKHAATTIKDIMRRHGVDTVYAYDIDEGSSPVIEPNPFDDNFTKTLDSISLEDDELTFEASDCCDNATYDEDSISSDALLSVAEWLSENEDALDEP